MLHDLLQEQGPLVHQALLSAHETHQWTGQVLCREGSGLRCSRGSSRKSTAQAAAERASGRVSQGLQQVRVDGGLQSGRLGLCLASYQALTRDNAVWLAPG